MFEFNWDFLGSPQGALLRLRATKASVKPKVYRAILRDLSYDYDVKKIVRALKQEEAPSGHELVPLDPGVPSRGAAKRKIR